MIEIRVEPREEDIALILSGRITSASVQIINAEIKRMMEQYGIPNIITIDMKDIVYINASAVRAIYYLVRFMFRRGGTVYFYGHDGIAKDFLLLCGITYPYPYTVRFDV